MKGNPGKRSCHRSAKKLALFIRQRRALILGCVALLVGTSAVVVALYRRRRAAALSRHRPKRGPNFCDIEIGYQNKAELEGRRYRFPSVQERIKLYMSNWYKIPCAPQAELSTLSSTFQRPLGMRKEMSPKGDSLVYFIKEKEVPHKSDPRIFRIDRKVAPARMFYGYAPSIQTCAADQNPKKRAMRNYCKDVNQTIIPLIDSLNDGTLTVRDMPIMFQFGDATEAKAPDETGETLLQQPRIPHFKKFRLAIDRTELDRTTLDEQWTRQEREESCQFMVPKTVKGVERLQPIIWKLNTLRHFGQLHLVPCNDVPWEEKVDRAVFRGNLNGYLKDGATHNAMERCLALPRCRLIWEYKNSKLVDARLRSTMNMVPDVIGDFNLTADPLPMRNMTSYKGIIILEGNDVSSGLKWAMLSSSVVLMAEPLFTSWAMEEWLEPWVHYIPIERDFSDLEEKVAWMIRHDAESRRISYRASLWIKDLVFHPLAADEEWQIFRGILERYSRHFAFSDAG